METILLKTTNLTLEDLRGKREVHHIEKEPRGMMAALGRVTPRSARLAMAGVVGLGALLTVETGLMGALAASIALALGLHMVGELDVGDSTTRHEIHTEGLSAKEVEKYWILNDEVEAEKKRRAKKEQQKATAGTPSMGGRS